MQGMGHMATSKILYANGKGKDTTLVYMPLEKLLKSIDAKSKEHSTEVQTQPQQMNDKKLLLTIQNSQVSCT